MGIDVNSCPKFIAMSMADMVVVCMEARICMGCLSHAIKYNQVHKAKCIGMRDRHGNKSSIACPAKPSCFFSIYTCKKHKDEPANVKILKKKKEEVSKMGWTMGMVTYFPTTPTPVSTTKVDAKQGAEAISSATSHQTPLPPPELNSFNSIQADKL